VQNYQRWFAVHQLVSETESIVSIWASGLGDADTDCLKCRYVSKLAVLEYIFCVNHGRATGFQWPHEEKVCRWTKWYVWFLEQVCPIDLSRLLLAFSDHIKYFQSQCPLLSYFQLHIYTPIKKRVLPLVITTLV